VTVSELMQELSNHPSDAKVWISAVISPKEVWSTSAYEDRDGETTETIVWIE
jgi:hypothetical protein